MNELDEMTELEFWQGEKGKQYTDNVDNFEYQTKNKLFIDFIANYLNKNDSVLEVGCNIGRNLNYLKENGFTNLTGVDIQDYALKKAMKYNKDIDFFYGSILDIPFDTDSFDVVFTSGVLIHINPKDITTAISELCRVSNTYIGGYEYYKPYGYHSYIFNGVENKVWRTDFYSLFNNLNEQDFSFGLISIKKEIVKRNLLDKRIFYLFKKTG